jgi:hypothetical protein
VISKRLILLRDLAISEDTCVTAAARGTLTTKADNGNPTWAICDRGLLSKRGYCQANQTKQDLFPRIFKDRISF